MATAPKRSTHAVVTRCVLASTLAATILIVFAIAVDVLANRGASLAENQNASGPESLAGSVWLGTGLTLAVLVWLGAFVARTGGGLGSAALAAFFVLPVTNLAAGLLVGAIFPSFYWYFLMPGGWAAY